MHDKDQYTDQIRKWLNKEWKRLKKGKVGNSRDPFVENENMPLITPTSKFRIVFIIVF